MAGVAVIVVADKEQRILLQHRHYHIKQTLHVNAFCDSIADLALGHNTGATQVRRDHYKISVAGREFFQGEGSVLIVFKISGSHDVQCAQVFGINGLFQRVHHGISVHVHTQQQWYLLHSRFCSAHDLL